MSTNGFRREMLELPILRNSLTDWSLAVGLMAVMLIPELEGAPRAA